jgi:hypothetical protein
MKRAILLFTVLTLLAISPSIHGEENELVSLKGIALDMKKHTLVDNWGFPAKRDHKTSADIWFYPNENTRHPTDGIVVYFKKGRVENWKIVDNMYAEMEVWGKGAGTIR